MVANLTIISQVTVYTIFDYSGFGRKLDIKDLNKRLYIFYSYPSKFTLFSNIPSVSPYFILQDSDNKQEQRYARLCDLSPSI